MENNLNDDQNNLLMINKEHIKVENQLNTELITIKEEMCEETDNGMEEYNGIHSNENIKIEPELLKPEVIIQDENHLQHADKNVPFDVVNHLNIYNQFPISENHFLLSSDSGYSQHSNLIHQQSEKKSFMCTTCGKNFSHKSNLNKHQRIHTNEKPFLCNVCWKTFTQKCDLIKHERIHTGEKPFSCSECDKKFSQHSTLVMHQRIHTGEKSFSCDVCHKTFNRKDALVKHQRTHTGEKPFICDVCLKTFNQKESLNMHKRIHSGEKQYSCDVCEKTFLVKGNLNKHKRIHSGVKPFSCDVCEKKFTEKRSVVIHKRFKHSDIELININSTNSSANIVTVESDPLMITTEDRIKHEIKDEICDESGWSG